MSPIISNCCHDVEFAVKNRDMRTPAMQFQAHISAQRQPNVVALRMLKAKLPALDTSELGGMYSTLTACCCPACTLT
jgi:hypothetical protein